MYDEDTTYLMIPGPVEVHPRVMRAMSQPIYGHRTDYFRRIVRESVELLRPLFGITDSRDLFILTGSGTAGLVASVVNTISPGDKVISLINGKFSERQANIASRIGAEVVKVEVEWGKAVKPGDLQAALDQHKDAKLVTVCQNETSTAILNPVAELTKIAHEAGAIVSVDAITAVGGDYVKTTEWDMDLVITGSQKCLGVPPGLAMISVGSKAWEAYEQNTRNYEIYNNFGDLKKGMDKGGDTPFTPAVGLFYGLLESLKIMHEEGLEARFKRHATMGEALRQGVQALGLELFAEEGYRSNTVTSIRVPSEITYKDLSKYMKKLGILIAGGQAHLKGKIFRINHMNLTGPREILMTLSALEVALKKAGMSSIQYGEGVAAAQAVIENYIS